MLSSSANVADHQLRRARTELECALRGGPDGAPPADEVVLVGATGGRLDQTLANVLILAQRPWPIPLRLVDGAQEAMLLRGPTTATLYTQAGATISAIPLSADVTGIRYTGLAYPLENATLTLGSTRGISNVAQAPEVTVTLATGLLLVVTGK